MGNYLKIPFRHRRLSWNTFPVCRRERTSGKPQQILGGPNVRSSVCNKNHYINWSPTLWPPLFKSRGLICNGNQFMNWSPTFGQLSVLYSSEEKPDVFIFLFCCFHVTFWSKNDSLHLKLLAWPAWLEI